MISDLPAQDIEAEKSLIGSLLLNNKLFYECEYLLPTDFYKTSHTLIFKTMAYLFNKGEKVDAGSVWYELKKGKFEKQIEDPNYLINIMESSPLFNTKKYVSIIKECSLTRDIKTSCMNILDSDSIGEDLLSEVQNSVLDIKTTNNTDDIKNLRDIIIPHMERLEKANTTKEGMYYSLGFPRIDRCLKTIGPKLIIIAGRPGSGKSALAVTMAKNLDRERIRIGFLSIEMPESEIIDRWLSMESGVDSSKFGKYEGFDAVDLQHVNDAASWFYESMIKIDGTGSLDIVDVERKCRKMKKDGVQVIFIDQLSQIGNRQIKSGEETARFSENCTRLARLKKELNLPIFLLAQLNRDMKNRSKKEPILSDLKQSGKIEEDADAVLFIHRPEEYADPEDNTSELKGKTVLNLAKNRAGAKFRDNKIIFNHETTYFYQGEDYG